MWGDRDMAIHLLSSSANVGSTGSVTLTTKSHALRQHGAYSNYNVEYISYALRGAFMKFSITSCHLWGFLFSHGIITWGYITFSES